MSTDLEAGDAWEAEKVSPERDRLQDQIELERRVSERTRELSDAYVKLREVDRLKSEFLATMSHELRTPLNSIIGFSSLLLGEEPGNLNVEQKKQLGLIAESARHLLELINDLLDTSRIESGNMPLELEELDLGALVRHAVDSARSLFDQKKLVVEVTGCDEAVPLRTDPLRFTQIMFNLLSNAAKFTSHGSVRVEYQCLGDNAEVSVTDTGIGIQAADLKTLFEPYRRLEGALRRYAGTGLGLYLTRTLARLLGGDVAADSEFGKGSKFVLRLPLKGPQENVSASPRRELLDGRGARLLESERTYLASIVESSDDAIIGKTLDGIILTWNQGAERLYGYTAKEVIGRSISVLAADSSRDEVPSLLQHLKQGESFSHHYTVRRRKDGSLVEVSISLSPIRDFKGNVIGASAISRQLEDSPFHARYTLLLPGTRAELADTIVSWSLGSERLFGWRTSEALGQSALKLVPPELQEEWRQHLSSVAQGQTVAGISTRRLHKAGHTVPVVTTITPVQESAGTIIAAAVSTLPH